MKLNLIAKSNVKLNSIAKLTIGIIFALEAISLIVPFAENITPPVVAACYPTDKIVNGKRVFKCDNRPSKCRRGKIVRINGTSYRQLICRR